MLGAVLVAVIGESIPEDWSLLVVMTEAVAEKVIEEASAIPAIKQQTAFEWCDPLAVAAVACVAVFVVVDSLVSVRERSRDREEIDAASSMTM